jgi:transposase
MRTGIISRGIKPREHEVNHLILSSAEIKNEWSYTSIFPIGHIGYFEGKTPREDHQGVLFLHDNATAHRPLVTQKKLAYLGFHFLDHPPYSPDLVPSDYTCSPE